MAASFRVGFVKPQSVYAYIVNFRQHCISQAFATFSIIGSSSVFPRPFSIEAKRV